MGRLLLRAVLATTFMVHGMQKLFGSFGGHGPDGTGQFFESLGLRPGRRHALAAGATETGGGALMAVGLATPAAAAGLTAVMITALRTAIWREGLKPGTGEFEVLLAAAALALADMGPGRWSLDAALGAERTGAGWALAALAGGALGSSLALASSRDDAPASPAGAATAEGS